jgi:hypothetical protein
MLQRQELQGTLGALLAPLRLGGSSEQPSQLPWIAGWAFFIPSAALLLLGGSLLPLARLALRLLWAGPRGCGGCCAPPPAAAASARRLLALAP